MAYDRFDRPGDGRRRDPRWSEDRDRGRWESRAESRGGRDPRVDDDDRGFFERAGDEIASWFGDDDAERRRRGDHRHSGRDEHGARPVEARQGDRNWDRDRSWGPGRYEDWNENRGAFARGGSSASDYNPGWRSELRSDRGRDDRSMGGGYRGSDDRFDSQWDRDPYRSTSRAGTRDMSDRSRHDDPHYRSWRDRHLSELDRDYDEYRREHQSKFESDFGSWRERRQQKRSLLGQIREHMEVVGSDDEHVGTVDKVAGDRIVLTKSDADSGGVHHSISCSDIDRVDDNRVILDCSADQARERWRDEDRSRALFEREDQGEMGPRMLDRSFSGTYR